MAVKLSEAQDINSIQYDEQAAEPATPNNGKVQSWAATDKKHKTKGSDALVLVYTPVIAVQTADATIANTVTETTLFGTVVGTLTLPANFLIAGRTIRITMRGHVSTTGTPNLTIRSKFGSTELVTTTAFNAGTLSNIGWTWTCDITCRSTGASGTVVASATFAWNNGSQRNAVKTTTTTIDTTATQAVNVTAEWGTASASNTITAQLAQVEVLY